jgi:hypothetical protein
MKRYALLLIVLVLTPFISVHAEGGCPPGSYPQHGNGWQTCVPIPGSNQGQQPAQPSERWESRWLAIALDTNKAILGSALNKNTVEAAEEGAMSDCRSQGGDSCHVSISTSNGCAAIVVGESILTNQPGSTRSDAESKAMRECTSQSAKCVVYFSACSPPIKVN